MADDKKPEDDLSDWLAGAAALGAAALGAWWLGKKIFGGSDEMTHGRAMKILKDMPILPYDSTPEQKEEFRRANAFLIWESQQQQGNTWYTKELAEMQAADTSYLVLEASRRFTTQVAKDLREMKNQGTINSQSSRGDWVVCPKCRGLTSIELRDYYGHLSIVPCPRCGSRGRVRLGD